MKAFTKRSIVYGALAALVVSGAAFHRWVFHAGDPIPTAKPIPDWILPAGCDETWTVGPFVFARKGGTFLVPSYGHSPHRWVEMAFHETTEPFYGTATVQPAGAKYEISYRATRIGEETSCPCSRIVIEWVKIDHVAAHEQWATSELPRCVGAVGEERRGQLIVAARPARER